MLAAAQHIVIPGENASPARTDCRSGCRRSNDKSGNVGDIEAKWLVGF